MRKIFLSLVAAVLLIVGLFGINTIKNEVIYSKKLDNSGYILKYTETDKKYYFDEQTKYKDTYNNQVVFKNTEGEKVSIDKQNFIHFENGSVSSFSKGVIADLKNIGDETITYYNISAGKVLKKLANDRYVTKNLNNDIEFSSILWKISGNKYLVTGKDLQILFSNGISKSVEGYLEFEYIDNEIVKIYNNVEKYDTISSDVYILIGDDIKLNLGNKCILKDDKIRMTLENMVIDSNDNVTIIDIEEYKEEEKTEEEPEEDNVQEQDNENVRNNQQIINNGSTSANSGSSVVTNAGTTVNIGENTGLNGDNSGVNTDNSNVNGENNSNINVENNGENGNNSESNNGYGQPTNINPENPNDNGNNATIIEEEPIETELTDALTVITPKYTVTEFKVTATGLMAIVEIDDEEARLIGGTKTRIINNATGRVEYEMPETGETEIKIDTNSLYPDTGYTLTMEASYSIDKNEYSRYFVYKIFRTPMLGVTMEKEMFTDNSLSFNIKFDTDSSVTKLDAELVGTDQIIEGIINQNGGTERIEFTNLLPDTEYTVRIKNIYVDNVTNDSSFGYVYKTLKSKPKLNNGQTHGNINVEIDKWNSQFTLSLPDLMEGNIDSYRYEVYSQTEGRETLVYTKITTDKKLVLKIDDETIFRNVDYYARVYASFYDNEKTVEYEFANTETSFKLNSSKMPNVRFETGNNGEITFNSIKGTLILEDEGKTIDYKNANLQITYSSTREGVDDNGSLTLNGLSPELRVPLEIENLKANETYYISVYATYNLHDETGEKRGYIGSIMITTKEANPLEATWTNGREGINIGLQLLSEEGSHREAETLYTFELELYLGQDGASKTPIATATIVDSGKDTFAGSIKTNYCDQSCLITQNTFGLTDAQMLELERDNQYCTIVIKDAKDTVTRYNEKQNQNGLQGKKFENLIPITANTHVYSIQEITIHNPFGPNDAMATELITKQRINSISYDHVIPTADYQSIREITQNSKINSSTNVAVYLAPNISDQILTKYNFYEYMVCDEEGNIVAESGLLEKNYDENRAPIALFLISNGTSNGVVDNTVICRGNTYYYKYYAYTTADRDEKYPSEEDDVDYWVKNGMPSRPINKQEPIIIMYPSTMDDDSISYKYKVNDIDNAIFKESNKKFFYHFYAGVAMFERNRKELYDYENTDDNGFWTVQFDGLNNQIKNYNLEVRILSSLIKTEKETYKTLTTQKFEEVLNNYVYSPEISYTSGIETVISLERLTNLQKTNLTKAVIELKATDNSIPNIIIEKSAKELNESGWKIVINYLDLIYNTNNSLKNKQFDINMSIYYLNNLAGYDLDFTDSMVTYQTVSGDWLRILRNKEFEVIEPNQFGIAYPEADEGHTYVFDNLMVSVMRNGNEIAFMNYAENGLVRKIGQDSDIAILPKMVKKKRNERVGNFTLNNIIPGIKSAQDLKTIPGPTNLVVKLNNLYYKDTIDSDNNLPLFIDVYDFNDPNTVLKTAQFAEEFARVRDLEKGKQYFYKIYVLYEGNKVYLYDLTEMADGCEYVFSTLDHVSVRDISVNFEKTSVQNGVLIVNHTATEKDGYQGIRYIVCDADGNRILDRISYSIDGIVERTTLNGEFFVNLDEFDEFGKVYISANRGSFFEFNTEYKIKITPMVTNQQGELEAIGDIKAKTFSHTPNKPQILLYAKRVKQVVGEESYIDWNISVSDIDKLITTNTLHYRLYKNDAEIPFAESDVELDDYITIRMYSVTNGVSTKLEDAYRLEIEYDYYKSNLDDTNTENVKISKRIAKIENGISVGNVNMEIKNNTIIKMKFYDSYELTKVKGIQCSIYDINGRILKNVPTINDVLIEDKTSDLNDPYKGIEINPNYVFEASTSYRIAVKLLDEEGNVLATIEPENPVTNNE